MSLSWYDISIKYKSNNASIFNGKCSVDNSSNAIIHFVNSSKININILDYPTDNYQADYKFVSNNFTFKGTVIKKINPVLEKKYSAIAWCIWHSDGQTNLSYLKTKENKWYDIVDNSGNYGALYSINITPTLTLINPKSAPRAINLRRFIKIYDKTASMDIFKGFFIVDINSKIISLMVNTDIVPNQNILTYIADENYSDYKFITDKNINQFTMAGTVIDSIPALDTIYGATEWQFWNYDGVNSLSYKNASNEWIALTPLNTNNRYSIVISNTKFT